jgi:glycosyltransferase involved in cell wall biosynthesis
MRVAVVAEFYPRADDPVLGVWAHRQALAARAAGAEVEVFVLHRLVPPRADASLRRLVRLARQPRRADLDGITVHYLPYVSPPRSLSYATWGRWAAPALRRAIHRHGTFDLVHAHNAVPAADAVRRAQLNLPLVVSVHGGDVFWTVHQVRGGRAAVRRGLSGAELVVANSAAVAERARRAGAPHAEVLHLGTDLPSPVQLPARSPQPLLATVGHLVARKRHADVLTALAGLDAGVRYLIIGDGPCRDALARQSAALGVADRVSFTGQLAPAEALARSRAAWLAVMPSVDEAFGVAYVEAMAAGIPVVACAGEAGPEEIASLGEGLVLVPPRDPGALAARVAQLLADPAELERLGAAARETVARHFTWERCGRETVRAYERVLRERSG